MFTILFGAIFNFVLWVAGAYIVYRVIWNKSITEKQNLKNKKASTEKLAVLMLKSSSSKEVSFFLKDNVDYLSEVSFKKLTDHLEFLDVMSEEPLKARFEDLENKPKVITLNEPARNVMDILENPPRIKEIVLEEPPPDPIDVLRNPPKLHS